MKTSTDWRKERGAGVGVGVGVLHRGEILGVGNGKGKRNGKGKKMYHSYYGHIERHDWESGTRLRDINR